VALVVSRLLRPALRPAPAGAPTPLVVICPHARRPAILSAALTSPLRRHAPVAPLVATDRDASAARRALDDLLAIYWFPLYAYLRRRGLSAHDAQDTTQGFLASLLERDDFATLTPARGKFRSCFTRSV
jgi:hypothetical protein